MLFKVFEISHRNFTDVSICTIDYNLTNTAIETALTVWWKFHDAVTNISYMLWWKLHSCYDRDMFLIFSGSLNKNLEVLVSNKYQRDIINWDSIEILAKITIKVWTKFNLNIDGSSFYWAFDKSCNEIWSTRSNKYPQLFFFFEKEYLIVEMPVQVVKNHFY